MMVVPVLSTAIGNALNRGMGCAGQDATPRSPSWINERCRIADHWRRVVHFVFTGRVYPSSDTRC